MKQLMSYFSSIDKKTWIIIIIAIILLIVLIVYLKNRNQTITTTTINPVATNMNQISNFPLMMGSRGPEVVKWQHYLNSKGAKLVEDGIWGPLTEAASKQYTGYTSVSETYFKGLGL